MSKLLQSLIIFMALLFTSTNKADEVDDLIRLQGYIAKHCSKNCVDAGSLLEALIAVKNESSVNPKHMLAIVRTESAFNTKASNLGNKGLAQILLRYHRGKFKSKNYFDPEDNIRVGAMVYGQCVKKHNKDQRQSFRCYNGYQYGDKKYYSKILSNLKEINQLGLTII